MLVARYFSPIATVVWHIISFKSMSMVTANWSQDIPGQKSILLGDRNIECKEIAVFDKFPYLLPLRSNFGPPTPTQPLGV